MLRVGSVCTGIGGFDLGFVQEGAEIAWMCEVDDACRWVLGTRFPGVPIYDDLMLLHGEAFCDEGGCVNCVPGVDVLIGGTPCQSFSLAGGRAGLDGESGLFLHFARLVLEVAPAWVVWENVPGVLSIDRGEVFADILEYLSGTRPAVPSGGWRNSGFGWGPLRSVTWRVLDAQHFGVPQRRRRVFIVGHLGEPWSASGEVLFEPSSREGDPEESYEAWEDDAPPAGEGVEGLGPGGREGELVSALTSVHGGPDDNMAQAGHHVPQMIGLGSKDSGDVASTLGSTSDGRGWNDDLDRMGALVVDEPILIGSEYDSKVARPVTACEHGHRYDMETENLLVEPTYVVHNGEDVIISEDVSMPVMGGTKGQPQAVTFRKSQRAHHADDCETWVEDDTANTLNAFENHNAERTTHAVVTPIDLTQACRTDVRTGVGTPGTGIGEEGGPSYPIGHTKAVPAMIQELSVRRLTPLECERLQGFPDEWTTGQSDSVRYKQLGNAVAVVCSRWVARRLLEVEASL